MHHCNHEFWFGIGIGVAGTLFICVCAILGLVSGFGEKK